MPNKVLVTGASGLLGVAAIEEFLSAPSYMENRPFWRVYPSLCPRACARRLVYSLASKASPVASRVAVCPVKFCQRVTATST